jgi:hypothetical protein
MQTCHESNQKLPGRHSNLSYCCFPSANVHLCSRLTPPDAFCPLLSIYRFNPLSFTFLPWMSPFYFIKCVCLLTLSHPLQLSTPDNCSHFTLFSSPFTLNVISSTSLSFWTPFGKKEYFFWLGIFVSAVKWRTVRAAVSGGEVLFSTTHCSLRAYCAILVRRSNFHHQASPSVSPRESTQRRMVELWARNVR